MTALAARWRALPRRERLLTYPFAALGAGWAWRLTRPREGVEPAAKVEGAA